MPSSSASSADVTATHAPETTMPGGGTAADDQAAALDVLYWTEEHYSNAFRDNLRTTLEIARQRALTPDAELEVSPLIESQVTKALANLSGPGETHFIAQLCARVGLTPTPDMGLYTVEEMLKHYPSSYARRVRKPRKGTRITAPDLVVGIVTPALDGAPETFTPVIFIEAKSPTAPISRGWGYCKKDQKSQLWGSQPTCLPHGCWAKKRNDDAKRDFAEAKWLWIGPAAKVEHPDGPWGHVQRPSQEDYPQDAKDFEKKLAAARDRWYRATLEECADWIADTGAFIGGDADVQIAYGRDANGALEHRTRKPARAAHGYRALATAIREWAQR